MRRDAHPDGEPTPEKKRWEMIGRGQNERERAGPEGRSQSPRRVRKLVHAHHEFPFIRNDERQGHPVGAPLGLEDPFDRLQITWIPRQTVEGLRRIGNELTIADQFGGPVDQRLTGVDRVDVLDTFHDGPLTMSPLRFTISDQGGGVHLRSGCLILPDRVGADGA